MVSKRFFTCDLWIGFLVLIPINQLTGLYLLLNLAHPRKIGDRLLEYPST